MREQVAIVGGGFAGLSAALHLVRERPGLGVTLLDAGSVGGEASGRNTGMLGPGAIAPITTLVRRRGPEGARRIFQATLDAVERALALVADEGLDCDLEATGQLVLARTERQAGSLRAQALLFQQLGFDVAWLDRDELRGRIASPVFRGALRYPRAAILDPLRLCQELARACRSRGVTVREGTRVTRVASDRLELATGEVVHAERIVLATNAFAPELGFLRGRIVPLHTHVVRTEPLGWRVHELGWPGREGALDARRFFSFFRLTADDRLLWGGGAPLYRSGRRSSPTTVRAEDPSRYAAIEREIATVFPALEGLEVERRWSGVMGFTLDRTPIVGALAEAPGVIFAGGWCGHGVALSLASGAAVADLVSGREAALPWHRGSAPWLPPDPLRGVGLDLYLAGLGLADRIGAALSPAVSRGAQHESPVSQ